MQRFYMIWDGAKRFLGLIFPFFRRARDFSGWGPIFRWTLRIVLLAVILGVLYWVNYHFQLEKVLTQAPPALRRFWLPILFLLFLAISWIGWWLWNLGADQEESVFPDIDKAWDEAVNALYKGGIDPRDVPLFLVLGRAAGTEDSLFSATRFQFNVMQAPQRPDAPLHVYANRDCLFVTCAGASLLGSHAAILAGEMAPGASGTGGAASGGGEDFDPNKTMVPRGRALDVQAVLTRAREQGRDPQHLTEDENLEIKAILAAAAAEEAKRQGRSRQLLMKNAAEIERLTARLKHLCRLIVKERRPYCPVNGIMVVVPAAATDSDEDASQTGSLCHQDLTAARAVFRVHCPIIALVGDLETVPGFSDFILRFPERERQRRVGQRFPYLPDLEGSTLEGKIEEVGYWICHQLIPSWVYKLFRVERPGTDSLENAVGGNVQLYKFLGQMRERQKRLSRVLARGILTNGNDPVLFGGCYLGGTGRNPREQAFVEGVFQRLIQDQEFVSWTDEAVAEDLNYHRITRYGYLGLVVFVVLLAVVGYFILR
jgi:hypothetical protein